MTPRISSLSLYILIAAGVGILLMVLGSKAIFWTADRIHGGDATFGAKVMSTLIGVAVFLMGALLVVGALFVNIFNF